ncbi:MAG: alpha/beta hydrolase [Kordiimonadaceae bacterium]|nr:alpha/beta hydrolase [Kordiimonadaceae bacterium]MBO6568361.1 alpha/beta hydrolase [Kordiimonadaceae bacterium]MBO6963910.1 alpha/beta hydrolase [Kordiimonadaceae bacterium]
MTPEASAKIHLVPGTACDQRLWSKVTPHLQNFELSFGSYEQASTLNEMVDHVAEHAPGNGHIVGFSLGGYLAAEAALAGKIKPTSLTLIAASLTGLSQHEKSLRRANAAAVLKETYKGMSRRRLAQFVHPDHMHTRAITDVILAMEQDTVRENLHNQLLATIDRRDLTDLLPRLEMPIHLIGATEDAIADMAPMQELSHEMHIQFSHIDATIATTGHMMPLEAPEALAKSLTGFFSNA